MAFRNEGERERERERFPAELVLRLGRMPPRNGCQSTKMGTKLM